MHRRESALDPADLLTAKLGAFVYEAPFCDGPARPSAPDAHGRRNSGLPVREINIRDQLWTSS